MKEHESFAAYIKTLPENTVFRLWKYKKIFTPYEQQQMFSDQSIYVDSLCAYVIIDDIINLPDGDILIKTHSATECPYYYNFYKLSEIELAQCDKDMEGIDEYY